MSLLEEVHAAMRRRHYSRRTEKAYVGWLKRFIRFYGLRHPRELGASDVRRFLSHLAVDRKVSAPSQNQALNALVFVYKHVLRQELEDIGPFDRPRVRAALPVVSPSDFAPFQAPHTTSDANTKSRRTPRKGLRPRSW